MILKRELYQHNGHIRGILSAISTTMSILFKNVVGWKKRITLKYPEEKYKYSDRLKGKHILTVKDDGDLRCISCMMCVTNCPARCIHIVPAEDNGQPELKAPVSFEIELLRCTFCGFCRDACPVDAIRLSTEYEMADHAEQEWLLDHHHLAYRKSVASGQGILSVVDDSNRTKIRL
jgi:NADH-quinone oxidoreductase subunit I